MATVNDVEVAARWAQALDLRRAGHTYQEIADALGFEHPSGAHYAVTSAMKAVLREPAADVRDLEADRLDRLTKGIWDKAVGGDDRKIATVLSIMDRRAKLLGLDAPTRAVVESTIKGYAVGNSPEDL